MKRYRFRLAQVQRVRAIELDRAAGEVALARHQLNQAQALTEARRQAYRALAAAPAGSSVAELRAWREVGLLAGESVQVARGAERHSEQAVEHRLAEWAEADRRMRLLDQLDERSRARHQAEALVEEQQVLDDLVTSRQGRDR